MPVVQWCLSAIPFILSQMDMGQQNVMVTCDSPDDAYVSNQATVVDKDTLIGLHAAAVCCSAVAVGIPGMSLISLPLSAPQVAKI